MRTKTLSVKDPKAEELSKYANFSKTGSIKGMKKIYYGKDAMLVKCGSWIYNVDKDFYESV